MDNNTKQLWLNRVKTGKIEVVNSHSAPQNTTCIWLKDGELYFYGNAGWEKIAGGSGGGLPVAMLKSVEENPGEEYSNLWFIGQIENIFTDNNMHLNFNSSSSPSVYYTGTDAGTHIEIGTEEDYQNWYENYAYAYQKTLIEGLTDTYGSIVQVLLRKTYVNDAGYPNVLVLHDEESGIYTAVVMLANYEALSAVISEGEIPLQEDSPEL